MSGRGGIYKGPNGEKMYGDGREVEVGSSTMSNAPDIPSDEAMWAVMSPASTIPAPLPLPADLDYLRGEIKIHVANLAKLREERDRAHAALREAKEFIENQQLPDGEWSRVLDLIVAALKPVSDRQPEGDLTLTQRLAARVGYTGPLAPETVDEVAKEEQQQTRQPEGETK